MGTLSKGFKLTLHSNGDIVVFFIMIKFELLVIYVHMNNIKRNHIFLETENETEVESCIL